MTDTFPRRNLPNDAEPWGRFVEDEINALKYGAGSQAERIGNQNRTTASSLEALARQIEKIEELYRAIPKPRQAMGIGSGFGLAAGWNTVAEARIVVPEDVTTVSLVGIAVSNIVTPTTTGNIEAVGRLLLNGASGSATIPGAFSAGWEVWNNAINVSHGWQIGVTPGQELSVALQIAPEDAASWPGGTASVATVTASMTFMG